MNFKDIWTVAKKELKAGFSDKVVLFQIILMPFLIVFAYAMLMVVMGETQPETDTDKEVVAYYVNAPEDMKVGLEELKLQSASMDQVVNLKKEIADEDCALVVVFPENFAIADGAGEELSNIDIWFNSSNSDSYELYNMINVFLDAFQPKTFSVNIAKDVSYDLGDEEEVARELLAMLMPVILLMSVFMVCMNQAAESVAGDKERGFLNTMLIAPVKRSSIAAGKATYLLIVAIIGGLSAFIGMVISLPKLSEPLGLESNFSYSVTEYMLLFVVTITAVFALASILLIVSTVAKDVKQATNVAPVFVMILTVGSMLVNTEGFKSVIEHMGIVNNLIPAWNTMLIMQKIIQMDYSMNTILISCGVNLLFSVGAIYLMGKFFESEKIVNG